MIATQAGKRAAHGRMDAFTLTELVITVTIVGILAAITIPSYRGYVQRAQRTEALNALSAMRTAQENYRNIYNTYTDDLDALGFAGGCTENCVYRISFDVAPDTRTYTARITPNPSGGTNGVNQMQDDDCSWFTIDARGRRAAENEKCLEGR